MNAGGRKEAPGRPGHMSHAEWRQATAAKEAKEQRSAKASTLGNQSLHVEVLAEVGELVATVRLGSKWRLTQPIDGVRESIDGKTLDLVRKHPTPPKDADQKLGECVVVESHYVQLIHIPARLVAIIDDPSCRSYLSLVDKMQELYPAKGSRHECEPLDWVTVLVYRRTK